MYDRLVKIQRTKLYFIETVIMIMVLFGTNLLFLPDKPAFEGINPNPYWIVVLAIAARYGRHGAIFSSVATSLIFIAHYAYFYGFGFFYDTPWILLHPFLFIQVGFIIGEVKTTFILREDYLTNRVEELENQNDKLKKENEIVKAAHKELTIDIATSQDTITMLNDISKKLKSIDINEIYTGVLESFRDYLGAEECSFYELQGNLLILKHSIGWKLYYRRPQSYEVGIGLLGLAAQLKETLSIKDVVLHKRKFDVEQTKIMADSALAVPVLGLEKRVYGVASIEKIPLLKLTDSTIQAAKITCELAASSLNNALTFQRMKEKQIKEEGRDLYKYHYFLSRLDEEFTRSLNYMLPLSIMAFKWPKLGKIKDERYAAIIDSIISLLKSSLRSFDVLATGPIADVPLLLLLATTSGMQANKLKEKIINQIKDYKLENMLAEQPLEQTIEISDFKPNIIHNSIDMLKVIGL
ncbi:MAG: GAF domain-containing protein [Pseudomonadota bacterium]